VNTIVQAEDRSASLGAIARVLAEAGALEGVLAAGYGERMNGAQGPLELEVGG
jgi:hypothetical protein